MAPASMQGLRPMELGYLISCSSHRLDVDLILRAMLASNYGVPSTILLSLPPTSRWVSGDIVRFLETPPSKLIRITPMTCLCVRP